MLKHKDLLDKLDPLAKVALVASGLRDEPLAEAGVPTVGRASLETLARDLSSSYDAVARSWNVDLIERYTAQIAGTAGEKGTKLFVSPDLKAQVDPYAAGMSEDPMLSGAFGAAIIRGVHAAGAAIGLSSPSLSQDDIDWLDLREDPGAVGEMVVKPFETASKAEGVEAIFMTPSAAGAGYSDTNRALFSDVVNGRFGDVFVVGENTTPTSESLALLKGKVSLGGAKLPIERAARRYRQLTVYRQEGSISDRDLEEAVREGSALSDERLDEAADTVVEFAVGLSQLTPAVPSAEYWAQRAAAEAAGRRASEVVVTDGTPAAPDAAPAADAPDSAADAEEAADAETQPAQEGETAADGTDEHAADAAEAADAPIVDPAPTEPLADDPPAEPEPPAPDPYDAFGEIDAELRTTVESTVLLRNDNLLPLAKKTRVAVIGPAYEDLSALGERFEIAGSALGYDLNVDRSDTMIREAVRACARADVILVFLHPRVDGDSLVLPANRLALLDALSRTRKPIVALVVGDRPVDLSFDKTLAATLIVPDDGPKAGEALAMLLAGEESPSGKLTRSAVDNAEAYYDTFQANRCNGLIRIGAFVGYRRFDAEHEKIRYPFGFGLSYTTFEYSDLRAKKDSVTFTIRNSGRYDGAEIAEIYVGCPSTSHVSPLKRLCAFKKVFLRAGESKRVTVALPAAAFETFDYTILTEGVEAGEYRIYVCASAQDVRLTAKLRLVGTERVPLGETPADYFRNEDYASAKHMRRAERLKRKHADNVPHNMLLARQGALLMLPIFGFVAFVMISLLVFSKAVDIGLRSTLNADVAEWVLYLITVVILVAVPLLLNFNRKRLRILYSASFFVCPVLLLAAIVFGYIVYFEQGGMLETIAFRALACLAVGAPLAAVVGAVIERELERSKSGNDRWAGFYEDAEQYLGVTPKSEFEQAFLVERIEPDKPVVEPPPRRETVREQSYQFYDKYLTLDVLFRDCKLFVTERGVDVDDVTLRNYLAAFFSSQLLIFPAGHTAELVEAVAEYLGHAPYIDNGETLAVSDDLLAHWKQSDRAYVTTAFGVAVEEAQKEAVFVHTALMRHVAPEHLADLLEPIVDVLARRKTSIASADGKNVFLPANLFFAVEVETDAPLELPANIAEVAAVFDPEIKLCDPAEHKTAVQAVGYSRLTALGQTVRDEYPLDESDWKNIDKVDAASSAAHIGNLVWLKMEMHAAIVKACGGKDAEALDGALAYELIPWLKAVWDNETNGGALDKVLTESFDKGIVKLTLRSLKSRKKSKGNE